MTYCDTCGHQFSDVCGGCDKLDDVSVEYRKRLLQSYSKKGGNMPTEFTSTNVEIPLYVASVLRIVQGRLEGFAAGYSCDDHQYTFLMDTAEMIMELLGTEDKDA